MNNSPNTTIRVFGCLHTLRKERGLKPYEDLYIPPCGCSGFDLAKQLGLPLEKIEGIFINHRAHALDALVYPGDRVALIPTGVPGPHRFALGIHASGKHLR